MDKQKLIHLLQSDPEINAAILFGSEAQGQSNRESDIDLGLLYNRTKTPNAFDLLNFKQDLSDAMHQDVDLVILNNASPIIAMQVVKNGLPLFIRDEKIYLDFEVNLITDYADLKRLREPFEQNILKRKLHD